MNLSSTTAFPRSRNGRGSVDSGPSAATTQSPIGSLSFLGFAVISFGGPLALAGLIAPSVITGAGPHAGDSAGLAIVV
jgi:hypothetical protein